MIMARRKEAMHVVDKVNAHYTPAQTQARRAHILLGVCLTSGLCGSAGTTSRPPLQAASHARSPS